MKKGLITFIILIAFCSNAFTQSMYVELGGPGLASINFDTRFNKSGGGIGGRLGIGGFSIEGTGAVFIPLGVNYLVGKDNKNYFEIGAGVTPVLGTGELAGENFSSTYGHLLFGYRMQPANGGFTFRAFISPIFGKGFFIPYFGGVSFGYSFGGKNR